MKPTILAEGPYRFVKLIDRSETSSHALVIATGVSYRKLDVAGIEKFTGAGVHYGIAMVQALSCKSENAYIDGEANSAGQAAIHFSKYSSKVIMLVRGHSLTKGMSQYLVTKLTRPKI
jgi:thioredoxin reductase (NADPH)